jgi:hypothetical protein
MTLMPPTKACTPSTTQSLRCRRRSWPGCSQCHQLSSGRNTASATPLPARRSRHQGMAWRLPKPSTSTRTRTPRRALRASCCARRSLTASVCTM